MDSALVETCSIGNLCSVFKLISCVCKNVKQIEQQCQILCICSRVN